MDIRYDENGIAVDEHNKPFIETDLFQNEVDPTTIKVKSVDPQTFFEENEEFIQQNYELLKKCYILLNAEAAIIKQIEDERIKRAANAEIFKPVS